MKSRVFVLVACFLFGGLAFACSCAPNNSVGEDFDRAAYVFTAVVIKIDTVRTPNDLRRSESRLMNSWQSQPRMIEGSIRVTSSLKGNAESLAAVYTHPDGDACGFSLAAGEEYLFFADQAGIVAKCQGNRARSSPAWRDYIADVRRYQVEGPPRAPTFRELLEHLNE